jgi:hypothetical protein
MRRWLHLLVRRLTDTWSTPVDTYHVDTTEAEDGFYLPI